MDQRVEIGVTPVVVVAVRNALDLGVGGDLFGELVGQGERLIGAKLPLVLRVERDADRVSAAACGSFVVGSGGVFFLLRGLCQLPDFAARAAERS